MLNEFLFGPKDAQAAVRLYTMFRKDWEKDILSKSQKKHVKNPVAGQVKNPEAAQEDKMKKIKKKKKMTIMNNPKTSDVPEVKLHERRYYSDSD